MNGPRTKKPIADTARDILAYLSAHPKAQDTIEGIIQWWLLEQDIRRSMPQVREALADLISRGLVVEQHGTDGRVRYRVDRANTDRVRDLLIKMT